MIVGYTVDPDRVAPLLPQSLIPAQYDGRACISLVGVELTDIRLIGLAVPGFRRVPLIELRIRVRPAESAADLVGSWTVQGFVPRRLMAWGAGLLYGESVQVASMQPVRREQVDSVEVTYRFDWKGREQRLRVRGERPPVMPAPDTPAHTVLGSTWRFGTPRTGTLLRRRVDRPAVPVYRVREHHVTVQWPIVFGDVGRLLTGRSPSVVLLAPSTPVTLRRRERG